MATRQAGYRRAGWRVYRREVGEFVGPGRRVVVALVALTAGWLGAVGADALFRGRDDFRWDGATRVVGDLGFGCVVVGAAFVVIFAVWWRRDRRHLPPVPWRDDRLVVDHTQPGAPELSAQLAPRLLASAAKQRFDAVGSLTMLLASFGAAIVGALILVGVTVVSGVPALSFAGLLIGSLSLPAMSVRSFDVLGRAAAAADLASQHPAVATR